jgi:hypothetical protein
VGLCVSALIDALIDALVDTLIDTLMVKEHRVGFTNLSE